MNHNLRQCLELKNRKHSPVERPVGRIPVKEGKNLPNSETEDVGGFSLCPAYSVKELRNIERMRRTEANRHGITNSIWTLKSGGRLAW
jgi:hypothetical protein